MSPIIVCPIEILNKVCSRYKGKGPWAVLVFSGGQHQPEASFLDPKEFITIANNLSRMGFTERGGYTDRGVNTLVHVVNSVKQYLQGQTATPNFANLYQEYFYISCEQMQPLIPQCKDLEGLLAIWCGGYAFITCCRDPRPAHAQIDFPPTQQAKQLARSYGLTLRGGQKIQVLYRTCRTNPLQCYHDFINKLQKYLTHICTQGFTCT